MELLKRSFNYCKNRYRFLSSVASKSKEGKDILCSNIEEDEQNIVNETEEVWPKRVVTGIQPTGSLHVGNYFGAIQRCVKLQDTGDDLMVFIADLHALTTEQDPMKIEKSTLEVAAYLLASGLDPERSVLFVQSAVPRHAELCWVLTCLATNARLSRLPQFREKSAQMKEVPLGLLLYPVLQRFVLLPLLLEAADVLVYRGTHVPVGRDQLQHLQVTSQLVRTFHHRYGRFFPDPRPICDETCDRLLNLRDPTKKMSKSALSDATRIMLSDSDEAIKNKIQKAVSDFTPEISYSPTTRPGVSNLVTLHCLATGLLPEEAVEEASGLNTLQYKGVVAQALAEHLRPVRERAQELLGRPALLRDVLRGGAARARRRADRTHAELMHRLRLAHDDLPCADHRIREQTSA